MSVKVSKNFDKNLSFHINNIFCGAHGQIKCLISSVNHFFLLKKQGESQLSTTLLTIIINKLSGIMTLFKIIEEEGIELKFLDYNANNFSYYLEKNKTLKINKEMVILEELSNGCTFIEQCEAGLKHCSNSKVTDLISKLIQLTKENNALLLGSSVNKI